MRIEEKYKQFFEVSLELLRGDISSLSPAYLIKNLIDGTEYLIEIDSLSADHETLINNYLEQTFINLRNNKITELLEDGKAQKNRLRKS